MRIDENKAHSEISEALEFGELLLGLLEDAEKRYGLFSAEANALEAAVRVYLGKLHSGCEKVH